MNYDIIDESISINDNLSKWLIPSAVMLFLALPLSFLLPPNTMTILVVISFAIGIAGHYFDSKPVYDLDKVIGEVHINQESISIKYGQTILVSDIKSITLISDYYQGRTEQNYSSTTSTGITELKIVDNLNETITIRFLVRSKEAFNYFKNIIRTYYIRKISIKETSRLKFRTLLLEPLKTYAENQALKKELGL